MLFGLSKKKRALTQGSGASCVRPSLLVHDGCGEEDMEPRGAPLQRQHGGSLRPEGRRGAPRILGPPQDSARKDGRPWRWPMVFSVT